MMQAALRHPLPALARRGMYFGSVAYARMVGARRGVVRFKCRQERDAAYSEVGCAARTPAWSPFRTPACQRNAAVTADAVKADTRVAWGLAAPVLCTRLPSKRPRAQHVVMQAHCHAACPAQVNGTPFCGNVLGTAMPPGEPPPPLACLFVSSLPAEVQKHAVLHFFRCGDKQALVLGE